MTSAWPAWCTLAALVVLLVLIIRFKVQAFAGLLAVSVGLGLAAGMPPDRVAVSIGRGVGDILAGVAIVLGLGAMLGRMLDASGAAEVIARTLIRAFGVRRASLAILASAYFVGIPVLFNVGFLVLMPIVWRLQRETGRSLLWFLLPLTFSLGTTHSLVPPHPGIIGAVQTLSGERAGTVMAETIIFGAALGIPVVLVGWFGPGRWWAKRDFISVPENLAGSPAETGDLPEGASTKPPSFMLSITIVTLPLLLSLVGFSAQLLRDLGRLPPFLAQPLANPATLAPAFAWLGHAPLAWLRGLGHPTIALLIPTGLAFLSPAMRRGLSPNQLSKLASDALRDVGSMAFLFGAAGGLKQVIQDSGAGEYIAGRAMSLPLSPLLVAYLVAVLMRIALGSATAAILTAAALLAGLAHSLSGQETLLVLAVANGVTFMTQPADSGFWLVKEYGNLSVRDVMVRFNGCRIMMSLTGIGLLLLYAAMR